MLSISRFPLAHPSTVKFIFGGYKMEKLIKKLEEILENRGLAILDKWDDGFTYALAVQHQKSVFFVYTTKVIHHSFRHGDMKSLLFVQANEYVPFHDVVSCKGTDLIRPYTSFLKDHGKLVFRQDNYLSPEEFLDVLDNIA